MADWVGAGRDELSRLDDILARLSEDPQPDWVRGGELFRLDDILTRLSEDPELLAQARSRFDYSPTWNRACRTNTTTRPLSSSGINEDERRHNERATRLIKEGMASLPYEQWRQQTAEVYDQLFEPYRGTGMASHGPYWERARGIVKAEWVEQGIWDENWTQKPGGRWQYEKQPKRATESESEADLQDEVGVGTSLSGPSPGRAEPKPKLPMSAEELRRIAEQRHEREREWERQCEATRPLNQFIYQVLKSRERILYEMNHPKASVPSSPDVIPTLYGPTEDEPSIQQAITRIPADMSHPEPSMPYYPFGLGPRYPRTQINPITQQATLPIPPDINTMAYERVKRKWIKRMIWDNRWGILPGMSWKHEYTLEEMMREDMLGEATVYDPAPVQANILEGDRHGTGEASGVLNVSQQEPPATIISGPLASGGHGASGASPRRGSPMSPLPAESGHCRVPGGLNTSPQDPPPAIDDAQLSGGDSHHSLTAPRSRRQHAENREAPCLAAPLRQRRGKRGLFIEGEQPSQIIAHTALGPIHSSKVGKARAKDGARPRRRPDALELRSEARQSSPGLGDSMSPLEHTPVRPRRSRRLEKAAPRAAADTHDGSSQSRPTRISAGTKPAGASERNSKTTLGRAK
jgi:hypothetical protein